MARVLVVDDYKPVRLLLREFISEAGHEVVAEAENGSQALEYYRRYLPDIVTMDIVMPVMDGISAAKTLLSMDPLANIIMCSSCSQQELVSEILQAGAKRFIIKPFDKDEIVDCIEDILCTLQ